MNTTWPSTGFARLPQSTTANIFFRIQRVHTMDYTSEMHTSVCMCVYMSVCVRVHLCVYMCVNVYVCEQLLYMYLRWQLGATPDHSPVLKQVRIISPPIVPYPTSHVYRAMELKVVAESVTVPLVGSSKGPQLTADNIIESTFIFIKIRAFTFLFFLCAVRTSLRFFFVLIYVCVCAHLHSLARCLTSFRKIDTRECCFQQG